MKNIFQILTDFQKIKNPSNPDFIKLGVDLSEVVILMPENQHVMLWEFVASKFSEDQNELIIHGASFKLKTDEQKQNFADGITQIRESIASLDASIATLKTIKDPGGSMKMAIDSLEKLKSELNKKYTSPTMN